VTHYAVFDHQEFDGQSCLNVHAYSVTGSGGTANALALQYDSEVLTHMIDLQSIHVAHTLLEVINLEDDTDFFVFAPTAVGTISGDALPPYCSFAIFWPRTTRASRNGHTRIPGVAESQQGDGVLNSTALGSVQAVADFLRTIDGPSGSSWTATHEIWRRPQSPEAHPPSGVTQAFFSHGQGIAVENVSTQNTRKFGRGR